MFDYINTTKMKDKELTVENNKRKHPERFLGVSVVATDHYFRLQDGSIRKRVRVTR
jgi:hypothetical protein